MAGVVRPCSPSYAASALARRFENLPHPMKKSKGNKGHANLEQAIISGFKTMSPKERARFLDLAISTVNSNSGTQQYGAGQSMRSRTRSTATANLTVDAAAKGRSRSAPRSESHGFGGQGVNKVLVLEETEILSSVNANSTFLVRSWNINAGLPSFLVKGSRIAQNYERYRFKKLEVKFVPTVSGYAAAGQAGRVVLAASLDALESPPSSLENMESMDPHVVAMPYETMTLSLDDSRLNSTQPWRYTRNAVPPAGSDLKTYDPGLIHFGVSGMGSTLQVGELHIHYVVELMNIRVDATPTLPENRSVTTLVFTSPTVPNATPTRAYANGFGAGPSNFPGRGFNGLGIVVANHPTLGQNVFYFPTGRFRITWRIQCDATSGLIQAFGGLPNSNLSVQNPFGGLEYGGAYGTTNYLDNASWVVEEIFEVSSWDGVTLTGNNWRVVDFNTLTTGTVIASASAIVSIA